MDLHILFELRGLASLKHYPLGVYYLFFLLNPVGYEIYLIQIFRPLFADMSEGDMLGIEGGVFKIFFMHKSSLHRPS